MEFKLMSTNNPSRDSCGEGGKLPGVSVPVSQPSADSSRPTGPVESSPADFSKLPETLQQEVYRSYYSTQAKWYLVNQFVEADPGRKIEVLRVLKGWTQQQLATQAALKQSDISRIEKKFGSAKFDAVLRVANALGISMRDLLFRGDDPQPISPE